MRLFGFEITRRKAAGPLSPVGDSRTWFPLIREPSAGAWQRGLSVTVDTALSNPVLFRCVSLISNDIAKMCIRLMAEDENGIDVEVETNSPFLPVLRKPNRYQNRIQFYQSWMHSKLAHGNTYVLKVRDNRGVVTGLYVLDPTRVKPLVAPDGAVYYNLSRDNISGLQQDAPAVPASEIIHDRWNCFFHPLVGLSPVFAAGVAALQGNEIQKTSTRFFQNGSRPGGVLTAPGNISQETADRLKTSWDSNYSGENVGKVAVLGDGLEYKSMSVDPVDAQLIEQLKWSAETICGCFGVPPYKAGVGAAPLNNNVESLDQQYYSQALQIHIESIELCLDEGLELPKPYSTEFELDDLLRMDSGAKIKMLTEGLKGVFASNEARKKMNLRPVEGGDAVLTQQQNYSLAAIAKRDAQADPFGNPATATPAAADTPPANENAPTEAQAMKALLVIHKGLADVRS